MAMPKRSKILRQAGVLVVRATSLTDDPTSNGWDDRGTALHSFSSGYSWPWLRHNAELPETENLAKISDSISIDLDPSPTSCRTVVFQALQFAAGISLAGACIHHHHHHRLISTVFLASADSPWTRSV